jgi:hypothetical protein
LINKSGRGVESRDQRIDLVVVQKTSTVDRRIRFESSSSQSIERQRTNVRSNQFGESNSSKECGDVDCKTFVSSVSVPSSTTSNDEEIDESLLVSASGEVSKDCHEDILTNWNEMLIKWRKNYSERPKGLKQLVQQGLLFESFSRPTFSSAGIPQALRCEVWQLLAESIVNEDEMIEKYRILLTQVRRPNDDEVGILFDRLEIVV